MNIEEARAELRNQLRDYVWFVGIGIGGPENSPHLEVRVSELSEEAQKTIPRTVGGFTVQTYSTNGQPKAF